MIFKLFNFLQKREITFCIINGYNEILLDLKTDSDIDILLKQQDFRKIEIIINEFALEEDLKVVQNYYQGILAKNIFIYNSNNQEFLNLDLYGELSRRNIIFFKEKNIFDTLAKCDNIPILSTEKEFIYYFIKKLDKNDLNIQVFEYLRELYLREIDSCNRLLELYLSKEAQKIQNAFKYDKLNLINRINCLEEFDKNNIKISFKDKILNLFRIIKRILNPTGFSIAVLGPDGAGKSTVINKVMAIYLPFRRKDYFHLKPLYPKGISSTVEDPHQFPPYSKLKSYIKLLYFIYQYNFGWIKNIVSLKIRSSLIIFDRYYDDLLVDNKRYRYGGNIAVAKVVKFLIPKPDLYFILTTDAKVIYERKQEVPFKELERQIEGYRALADGKKYFNIDVNRTPEEIVKEITQIIMEKMSERY